MKNSDKSYEKYVRLQNASLLLNAMVGAFEHILSEMTDMPDEDRITTMFKVREMELQILRDIDWVKKDD